MEAGHAYGQALLGIGGPGLLPGFWVTLGSFFSFKDFFDVDYF